MKEKKNFFNCIKSDFTYNYKKITEMGQKYINVKLKILNIDGDIMKGG